MEEAKVLSLLNRINTWWSGEPVPDSLLTAEYRRRDFYTLRDKLLGDERILVIRGPRQVGKTTVTGQLVDYLVNERRVPEEQVLYLNIENSQVLADPENIIEQSLDAYETHVLEKSLRRLDGTAYVFVDEIQKAPDWASTLKYYTDTYANLKFTVTGSVSTLIDEDANETLVGRLDPYLMLPMKFADWAKYRGILDDDEDLDLSVELRSALERSVRAGDCGEFLAEATQVYATLDTRRPELESLKDDYLLKGGYPGVLDLNYVNTYSVLDANLQSTVLGDMPSVFPIDKPQKLLQVLNLIGDSAGSKINVQNIADTANISRDTVESYLDYLEEFYLIDRCEKYSSSAYRRGGRDKAYVRDVGHLNAMNSMLAEQTLQNPEEAGRILETACFDHARRLQFCLSGYQTSTVRYWDGGGEVDFVLSGPTYVLPIEVKHGDSRKRNLRGLQSFLDRLDAEFGIVVNGGGRFEQDGQIVHLPAWLFLFLC